VLPIEGEAEGDDEGLLIFSFKLAPLSTIILLTDLDSLFVRRVGSIYVSLSFGFDPLSTSPNER